MNEVSESCSLCNKPNDQMLMLSCVHDPCINCAASAYAEQIHLKNQNKEVSLPSHLALHLLNLRRTNPPRLLHCPRTHYSRQLSHQTTLPLSRGQQKPDHNHSSSAQVDPAASCERARDY